ncbi:hypothetical protein NRI_0845 [Neorickettsia risticii str. Illinois]|uniref:Uncharacterized protein n=1 Tax=Neorickettsia risticii (strain Illinois) TaxID=434131 RepID=C6V5Z4_NEORI|nr:hypothetical protein NRI_0845 [Neorickettsia risticii str. Illinois]
MNLRPSGCKPDALPAELYPPWHIRNDHDVDVKLRWCVSHYKVFFFTFL